MNLPKLLFRLLLGRRLPTTQGTITVSGIQNPIVIHRDRYGIPYIDAQNEADAWYGLGFCQGQDRAFQLESSLRIVRGRLAEVIGPVGLPIDRLSRRIGFYRSAQKQVAMLDADTRQMIEAYARGIHAGATQGCRRPAHEFALLRSRPLPFEVADILGVLKMMSFLLASNWDMELSRYKILMADGIDALRAIDLAYPEWMPVSTPPLTTAGPVIDRLMDDFALFTAVTGQGAGSNNWVLAPSRTATGRPLLANDPHLASTLPPAWYLAHMRTPDWAVAGTSFVGMPSFPAGHNGTAAWGVTAGVIDNTDLFLEEIGPDGRSVRQGDTFVPCEVVDEVIQVKGGEAVTEQVLITPRGPIISPALEGVDAAFSMETTWLKAKPAQGLMHLHKARSFDQFQEYFAQWPFLSLNMVYADTNDTIGWKLVGDAPKRRKGWGTIPLPGSHPDVGWEDDPIPHTENPHAVNPESGFLATANNKPIQDKDGPFLGADWLGPYRLRRIQEILSAREDWDIVNTQQAQMDQKSLAWQDLRQVVLNVPVETGDARQALTLLSQWDGKMAANSAGATLYQFFMAELQQRMLQAKTSRALEWASGKGFHQAVAPYSFFILRHVPHLVKLVQEQPDGWFDQPWPDVIAEALSQAWSKVNAQFGPDPTQWQWGQIRPLTLLHSVGAQSPMNRIFNLGPFPWGGNSHTVNVASTPLTDLTASPVAIPSMRMVIDVGDWEASQYILPGGQSGNPLSPHYDDQLSLWQAGKGIPIAWSPQSIAANTQETLQLTPG